MKKIIHTLLFVFSAQCLISQTINPEWQISLNEKIKWLEVNDWGIVLACTDEKLYGLSPADGSVLWETGGLSNMKREGYSVIDGTPIALLEDGPLLKAINGATGQVIFDSQKAGYKKVKKTHFLGEVGGILIEYKNAEEEGLALFDVQTGERKWDKSFSASMLKGDIQPAPVITKNGQIIHAGGKNIVAIDGQSGSVLWESEGKKPFADLFLDPTQTKVMAVQGSVSNAFLRENDDSGPIVTTQGNTGNFKIEAFDIKSGSVVWSHEYKSKYGGVGLGSEDLLLVHAFSINFINFETGKMKWKAEPKYVGGGVLLNAIIDDQGILYAVESHVTEGKVLIYYLNHDGEKIWKKPPYTNPTLLSLQKLENGVLYISPRGANMADIETGKDWWSGDQYLTSGDTPIMMTADANGRPVLLINGQLIRILAEEGKWELLASDARLKAGMPATFAYGEDGYLITSPQEALLIGKDGKRQYHRVYAPPAQSIGKQVLLSAAGLAMGMVGTMTLGMNAVAYSMAGALSDNESYSNKGALYADLFVLGADISEAVSASAAKRFSTQLEAPDYKLIMCTKDNKIGLAKIDLKDGTETGFIFTDDRTPEYVLDEIDHVLYFKSGSQRIAAYPMK